MFYLSNKIKELIKNDYAISHELRTILSFGIEFRDIDLQKNKLIFDNPDFTNEFLKEYKIVNTPELNFYEFKIYLDGIFELNKPKKEQLIPSVNRYFKDDLPNREFLVQNAYEIALNDIKRKEQHFTKNFILTINARLEYLEDSINIFNRYKSA
jgi:hypothetical protein